MLYYHMHAKLLIKTVVYFKLPQSILASVMPALHIHICIPPFYIPTGPMDAC